MKSATILFSYLFIQIFWAPLSASSTTPTSLANALFRGGSKNSRSTTTVTTNTSSSHYTKCTSPGATPRVDTGPLKIFISTITEARRHLAAAAVARGVSILSMYPVDTIKTRIQMEQKNPLRLDGLYKGVAGSLIGQVPYGVLTFGSYEIYKKKLLKRFPDVKPVFLYALSAILGDVTGSGWLCPSEVVKQQMQAGMYGSMSEAVKGIWTKKGLQGFYQGYFGGLARDVPFRVAQLTSYEVTKSLYQRLKQKKDVEGLQKNLDLSPIEAAVCGAVAGTFSAAITSPLDRIKTLLMTDSAAYGGSVASCAAKIWKEEGLVGFCQGVIPRVSYIAPSVVIFFITYEQVQQRLFHSK